MARQRRKPATHPNGLTRRTFQGLPPQEKGHKRWPACDWCGTTIKPTKRITKVGSFPVPCSRAQEPHAPCGETIQLGAKTLVNFHWGRKRLEAQCCGTCAHDVPGFGSGVGVAANFQWHWAGKPAKGEPRPRTQREEMEIALQVLAGNQD